MAGTKRRKKYRNRDRQRGHLDVAKHTQKMDRLIDRLLAVPVLKPNAQGLLREIEDRRSTYVPSRRKNVRRIVRAMATNADVARTSLSNRTRRGVLYTANTRDYQRFEDPRKTIVCRRRQQRRNVLFATRRAGKGKKVSRYRRMTENSNIRC